MASRVLLVLILGLALAAPAWAASGDAPGALKKQETTATETLTSTPVPTAPATEPAPAVKSEPKAEPKATLPATKGTTKKVAAQQPAAVEGLGDAAASHDDVASTATRARRRSAARRTSRTTTRRATSRSRRASRSGIAGRTRRSAAAAERASKDAGASGADGGAATAAGGKPGKRSRARAATAGAQNADPDRAAADDAAPLTAISNVADNVVEVIPGVVVLALAGLAALCLLLVARSWAIERRRGKALAKSYGITVEALATAIEAKDHCTGGHIERVRKLGLLLAAEIVPREARDPQMEYGFLLHDIGKLAVPDAILRAPGRLSDEDWALMRRHPEEGVRMLANVPFLDRALDVVRDHHERWDGGGYPRGLHGEEIPLWARIFSVVDALDAMTAARPYRAPRSYQEAVAEIQRHAGTQFDPDVVDALERIDPAKITPLLEPTQLLETEPAPVLQLAVPA